MRTEENSRTQVMNCSPKGKRKSSMSRRRSTLSGSSAHLSSFRNPRSLSASSERSAFSKTIGPTSLSDSRPTQVGRLSRTQFDHAATRGPSPEECTQVWNQRRAPGPSRSWIRTERASGASIDRDLLRRLSEKWKDKWNLGIWIQF